VGGDKIWQKVPSYDFLVYRTENTEITETLRDLADRKCFYLIFCQKNDKESLKTMFLAVLKEIFKIFGESF
jgi:hypothetical protein